ncbi:phage protein NinX family protein [Paraburkholderia sediminicola]|uniref:phage protein NinX family protein n=1 Tax=Paraburkholderia sediminicola TaxID=458836 RepID=UPI0038BC50E6
MKVSELSGAHLDYWAARAEGKNHAEDRNWGNAFTSGGPNRDRCVISHRNWDSSRFFEPSKNWTHGGPIIERAQIGFTTGFSDGEWCAAVDLNAYTHFDGGVLDGKHFMTGPTPLVAAMRCYIASKFGEEVADEVPT